MASRLKDIITYYPSSADTITAELCNLLNSRRRPWRWATAPPS